jgi:hypothetical protein
MIELSGAPLFRNSAHAFLKRACTFEFAGRRIATGGLFPERAFFSAINSLFWVSTESRIFGVDDD